MRFESPEWLIVVVIFVLVARLYPHLRIAQPLRALSLTLITLILMQPQYRTSLNGLDLWVLADRSLSAAAQLEARLPEWEALLDSSRGSADRLFFIEFADNPMLRGHSDAAVYSGGRSQTNIAQAVDFALAQITADKANRLLILTDGASTEPLEGLGERLNSKQISLDYRLLRPTPGADFSVARFSTTARVLPGEPLLIEGQVLGTSDGQIGYQVFKGNQLAHRGTTEVINGRGSIQFSDRLSEPGAYQYRLELDTTNDVRPGNNSASTWTEVSGQQMVLLVSSYAQDPLAQALAAQNIAVNHVVNPATLSLASLTATRTVVLNNVAAHHLPSEFISGLEFFVTVQGGGLLMIGGESSFGSGGYYGSSIDPLLPVTTELREEHRKYLVAMAIVLDRSGSMSAGVGGGSLGQLTKMDLANEGAAEAISLLGARDMVTVFAVDSSAHTVVPLLEVGPNRGTLLNTVRGVNSEGGGIYVYEGLRTAWKELSRTQIPQKHIILFSDAADSEEPGNYKELLEDMRKAGGTVSVIGLGTETDSDAELLKDIAKRGEGRMFFSSNAKELPALFAQETVSVARSTFVKDSTIPAATGAWQEVASRQLNWPAKVDGYNLNYLRPDASAAAISTDEFTAPLVAYWSRGIGRTAAIAFPMSGEYSQSQLGWPDYSVFIQTLVSWLVGKEQLPGISLRTRIDGQILKLELFYSHQWENQISLSPPKTIITSGEVGSQNVEWTRVAPGAYSTVIELQGTEVVRGAVQIGSAVLPFGPVGSSIDPEWSHDPKQILELKLLAESSRGVERLDLTTIWNAPRNSNFQSLQPPLLWTLLVVVLLEALATRLGSLVDFPGSWLSGLSKN